MALRLRGIGLPLLLTLAACSRLQGCHHPKVAELLEAHGSIERDFADHVGEWKPAALHAQFGLGDGLRTGPAASALLRVGRSGRMQVRSETTLRFATSAAAASAEAAPRIDLENGEAVLETGQAALPIRTARGSAVLRAGTRVQLQRAEAGTRYKILIGGADFTSEDGKSRAVAAGDSVVVGIGLAVLESDEHATLARPSKPTGPLPSEAPHAQPAAPDGGTKAANASPVAEEHEGATDVGHAGAAAHASTLAPQPVRSERAEVLASIGQSFRVYDPAPPTAVALALGKHCPGSAELRISGRAAVRGAREISVPLAAGVHRYTLHCLEGDVASARSIAEGTILVLKSDGVRTLPTRPSDNDVDLDGRKYTLMYQNLKPIVHVRWPNAPAAPGYVLQLLLPSGERKSLRAKEPRYTLEPTMLGEGVHTLQFESSGASRVQSKPTPVAIVFDNAAPTASLSRPPPQGFTRAAQITVAGVAVEGSQVAIDRRPVKLDAQQRFSTEVELDADQHALSVRFQHRKYGVHYYVRREAGWAR